MSAARPSLAGILAKGLSVTLLLMAIGCAPRPSTPQGQPEAPQAAEAPKLPKRGGTLKLGTLDAPEHRHILSGEGLSTKQILVGAFDPLINLDNRVEDFRADFPVVPWLV